MTENIDVAFTEPRHGIYRDIDTQGLSIEVQTVKNKTGQDWNYVTYPFSEGTRVQIGDANILVSGEQTYKIGYLVHKGIQFYNDHEELYWNVTGNAWPVEIHAASATVKLPDSVKGSKELQFACYTGEYMSEAQDCKYTYDKTSNAVTFTANSSFLAYSGLTVRVSMPAGTFKKPSALEVRSNPSNAKVYLNDQYRCDTDCIQDDVVPGQYKILVSKFGFLTPESQQMNLSEGMSQMATFDLQISWWYAAFKGILMLLALAVALEPIYTYFKKGRDPKGRGTIVPEYEAPDGLTPAEVGTLYDERADIKDLIAAIIDLCVRGYITIKVLPKAEGLIFKQDDYEFGKTSAPKPGDKGLSPFENKLMDAIFVSGSTRKLSDMRNKFYTELPELDKMLYDGLVTKGYFPKNPNSVRALYLIKGFLLVFVSFWIVPILAVFTGSILAYCIPANGVLTLLFFSFMPRKTDKGVEAYEHILGYKKYIETAEKDRVKFQESENLFYTVLPFAMTMGVADKWSNAFRDVFKQPPTWYQGAGSGPFHPSDFVHHLGTVSNSMSSTFRSQPGGHGGGGGGFSGGGGGGGGGGSW